LHLFINMNTTYDDAADAANPSTPRPATSGVGLMRIDAEIPLPTVSDAPVDHHATAKTAHKR
jgi:hypothetical protein